MSDENKTNALPADWPHDPVMLLGFVNMRLRDYYDSLAQLCDDANISPEAIQQPLAAIDYHYDPATNQFK